MKPLCEGGGAGSLIGVSEVEATLPAELVVDGTPSPAPAVVAVLSFSPPGDGGGFPEATEEAEGDGVLSSLEILAVLASANCQ